MSCRISRGWRGSMGMAGFYYARAPLARLGADDPPFASFAALPLDRRGVYLYGLEWALAKARRRGALLPVVVGLALPATAFQASIAFPASQGPYNWFHLLWRAAEVRAPSASAAVAT